MIAFAVLFGLLAVFVAQSWLNSAAEQRMRSLEANKKPVSTNTIVVASKPLRFGNELTASQLREAQWPEASLPSGSFAKISDVLNGGKRVALTAIEPNEPVLNSKITGPGQRALPSGTLKAYHLCQRRRRVGGFVLPGDRSRCGSGPAGRQDFGEQRGRAAKRRAGGRSVGR
jgi:pilus assembly protein CpaB